MQIRQDPNESIIKYLQRIKEALKYCNIEKLRAKDVIRGWINPSHINKRHEQHIAQTQNTWKLRSKMNLEVSVEFLKLELIKEFNQQKHYPEIYNTTKFMVKGKHCGKKHEIRINVQPWKKYVQTTKQKIISRLYTITKEQKK